MAKKIITIQHTEAEHHKRGIVGGWTNLNLTEEGKIQADNIGINLKNKFENDKYIIYSSDLLRAKTTAEIIAKYTGTRPIYRQDLREQCFGIATNQTQQWFREHRSERNLEIPLIYHRAIEGAETGAELYNRVINVVKEIDSKENENIVVVGHGGSIHMFVAAWLGIPVTMLEKIALIGSTGGVSMMSERNDGSKMLNFWNNTSYIF